MKMRLRWIFPLLLACFTAACSSLPGVMTVTPSPAPSPSSVLPSRLPPQPLPTAAPSLTASPVSPVPSSPPPSPTLAANPSAPLPAYTLAALMDYEAKTLGVEETLLYTHSGETTPTLVFVVRPNELPNVFSLEAVQVNDAPLTEYLLDGPRLTLTLPAPLEAGQSLQVDLRFRLVLPEMQQGDPNLVRPQIFGVSERQVNLTDWYPMLVPYVEGEGWRLHDPWFYGEHLVYPLANFEVTLRFSDPANAPSVIAASGDSQPVEAGARYRLQAGRTFAFAMGKTMQAQSAQSGQTLVTSYFYPGSEAAAQAALQSTLQALETYTELFGQAYPHPTLAVVQGDFNDGMEFDGLYYLSNAFYNLYDGSERNYLVLVAAHETCHQWWFGLVANDQFSEPWLDESLATWCERAFYEHNYPDSVAWWQSYRIDFYQPGGFLDGDVRSYSGFTPYTDAVYRRGAQFLQQLRQQIGEEAFLAFLRDYAHTERGKIVTAEDFFRLLRAHTATDVSALLREYFSSPR